MSNIRFSKLCACLLNVSEAKNSALVHRIAKSAVKHGRAGQCAVLNIFSDYEYNRSVITIASPANHLANSVVSACTEAYNLIDISLHEGGHPRLGSVDLVPIHPLSEETTLEQCGEIAKDIAYRLSTDVPGSSFFLFGHADRDHRGLVQRRKEVKWYSGEFAENSQDIGAAPGRRYGLTGIGAIPYVMNCNVTIATKHLDLGRKIAHEIRATSPNGLPGVQSMAFYHEGNVEIACNVESMQSIHLPWEPEEGLESGDNKTKDSNNQCSVEFFESFGDFYYVSPKTIQSRIATRASEYGVKTKAESIVGFTPEEARRLAVHALSTDQFEIWKTVIKRTM